MLQPKKPTNTKDKRNSKDTLVINPIKELGHYIKRTIPTNTGDIQYSKSNDPEYNNARKDFVEWYSNPATISKFEKNTRYDPDRLKDLVSKGASIPSFKSTAQKQPPVGSKAVFNTPDVTGEKEEIVYHPGVGSGVIQHEIAHGSAIANILGPALLRATGSPKDQKLPSDINDPNFKSTSNSIKDYMSIPSEAYGNFHEFRVKLGLKPGDKIDREKLRTLVKEKNLNQENFYNTFEDDKIVNAINTVAYNNKNNLINQAAMGGYLQNTNQYANGGELTRFDEGGTHEQNPIGGIPQGQSPDGTMNTVEQGETKNNDYIYSNRISLDKGLVKQFNLPGYVANKSVSDASKAIDNKFKDRFDKYSTETKTTLLDRLTEAQEFVKQQEQAQQDQINQSLQANSQQVPDMMNGEIPAGMEEFVEPNQQIQSEQVMPESQPIAAYGGYQRKMFAGGYTNNEVTIPTSDAQVNAKANDAIEPNSPVNPNLQKYASAYSAVAPTIANVLNSSGNDAQRSNTLQSINSIGNLAGSTVGGYVAGATGLYEMGDEAFGKSNIDTSGNQSVSGANVGKSAGAGALKGAATGAMIGSVIPGIGTLIGAGAGAILGGVSGLVGGKKDKKAQERNNSLYSKKYNSQFSDQYAKGGKLPRPKAPDLYPNIANNYDTTSDIILPDNIQSNIVPSQTQAQFEQYANLNTPQTSFSKTLSNIGNKASAYGKEALKYAGENYGEALRYAPVALNAYQLSKLKKPTGVQYNTLDNRYKPTYVDEARMQNIVDQEANNQINAISQLGGSQGATRNAILAAGLNKTKALSGAYANAAAQNAAENQTAQQFNLGVDSTNVGIRNKAIDEMRMDQGNYDTQKSKLLSSLGTDIGSIGREVSDKKQIADLLGYTWDGKYIVGKDGKPVSPTQLKTELAATKSQSAYGGKLNLKYK